jgi:hypothetical protein
LLVFRILIKEKELSEIELFGISSFLSTPKKQSHGLAILMRQ